MEQIADFVQKMVGHLAWPGAITTIAFLFKNDLSDFIQRIRNAKYGEVELDLTTEIDSVRDIAGDAGVTIFYPAAMLNAQNAVSLDEAPELTFMQSWQEIENLITKAATGGEPSPAKRRTFQIGMEKLTEDGTIDPQMAELIRQLKKTRDLAVHHDNPKVTKGETVEWLGVAKSVRDRLSQKLEP